MKLAIVYIGLFISLGAWGQLAKFDKATMHFQNFAYSTAIPLFEELIGSKVDDAKLKSMLAFSYFQVGNTEKAEAYYSQMILSPIVNNEDYYNYAQVLKENGKYKQSDQWMMTFAENEPLDTRAQRFQLEQNYLKAISEQEPFFQVEETELNTEGSDFGGYFSTNNDEVYFITSKYRRALINSQWAWDGNNFLDVFKGELKENHKALKNISRVKKINTKFHEGPLCFSPDGKRVYYTRNNASYGEEDKNREIKKLSIYIREIDEEGAWGKEKEISFASPEFSVGHPCISKDGKTLYFSSDMPGGFGRADIYSVEIMSDGSFGNPVNLGGVINTEGQEMFPWMDEKGNLYYASDGLIGLGGLDVYIVKNLKESASPAKPINLGRPLNSRNDDFAFVMSHDGKTGFVSSNRIGGVGNDDIYTFTQLREISDEINIDGVVRDEKGDILVNAKLYILDSLGTVLDSTNSSDKGDYSFRVKPNQSYTVWGKKPKYFDDKKNLDTQGVKDDLTADLVLEKDPGISMYGLVADAKSGAPLEGVKMTIIDNMTGKKSSFSTPEDGLYRSALPNKKKGDRGSYNFVLEKDGYFSKVLTYNVEFDENGQFNINDEVDLSLDPIVKNLEEMITINPINFDYGKYNIRPDAAVELDKIVAIMNKYPEMVIELGAHTDCRGSARFNEKLSDRRAKASANYIKQRISNPERIYGKGYGEYRLLNDCGCEGSQKSDCTEAQHQENRRTEFRVIATGNDKVKVENQSSDSF
ncbi:WD40-like Beta Propeller Repeat [Lishizhenia tianjinensis]|uniref:WD40-like Beta Propeller Repeat n=1 Tax=Lishizhenia tianjinensis TaxID=477690 RepID=A0A1I6ZL33_9FLAO|nr:OmpA family protein [Lishizhenia tianjinensis]SFT63424.1 WD40-like Beta Propeller Repeat [Lishizhenia tianjinensis]